MNFMPMSKDQKWTGTGIAVVAAVLVIVAAFQPHIAASPKAASAASTPGPNGTPAVLPTVIAAHRGRPDHQSDAYYYQHPRSDGKVITSRKGKMMKHVLKDQLRKKDNPMARAETKENEINGKPD